jgi:hypothetical protein
MFQRTGVCGRAAAAAAAAYKANSKLGCAEKVNQIKLFLLTINRSLIIFHFGITGQLCSRSQ